MSVLFKGVTVVALDDEHGTEPFIADVQVEGDRIVAVGTAAAAADSVVDGHDRLLMPGLVNAHLHSWEALFKGRYENLPLELWMLLAYPILAVEPLGARLIELRSQLVAIESLRNGVTTLIDDVIEMPTQSMEALEAVFRGYAATGVGACVSGNIVNRPYIDTIPYVDEVMPAELLAEARARKPLTTEEYLSFSEEAIRRFHDPEGRLRYFLAPSGPQRCTDDLLVASDELARSHDIATHIHVLETKVQAVTGREFYGCTLVERLQGLGVLGPHTAIAHGIWLTASDIATLADCRSSVVHNPISNQKLGAGIAPWRELLDAGVNVALGTDGLCSNDSARMFDVVKSAALLHSVSEPDYTRWPTASEVLWSATRAGARSAMLEHDVGSIEVGKRADLVLLDLGSLNFVPRNDLRNHLVYCENGSSILEVYVAGERVVAGDRCTRIDQEAVIAEFRELADEALARHAGIEKLNQVLYPYFDEIHRRCCREDIGLNRYSQEPERWLGRV